MHKPPTATIAAAITAAAIAAAPGAAFASSSVPEGNFGTTRANVSIELEQPVPHLPVTVHYETHDGTATAGSDYIPTSGWVTFGPFDTERTVHVSVIGDTLYEGNEYFFVDTSSGGAGDEGGGQKVTIVDDDPAPVVSVSGTTVSENGGSARFDVSLSAPSGAPTTVAYSTADGSATAGSDYVATSGTLTFAPGETSKSVSVDLVNDAVHEDAESFSLALSSPVGATLGTAQANANVIDDDPAPVTLPAALPAATIVHAATPAAAPAPAAALRIASVRLTRSRALLVKLACSAGTGSCAGSLDVTRGSRLVGSARYALVSGTSGDLAVALPQRLRRLLARGGRVSLTVTPSTGAPVRFTL